LKAMFSPQKLLEDSSVATFMATLFMECTHCYGVMEIMASSAVYNWGGLDRLSRSCNLLKCGSFECVLSVGFRKNASQYPFRDFALWESVFGFSRGLYCFGNQSLVGFVLSRCFSFCKFEFKKSDCFLRSTRSGCLVIEFFWGWSRGFVSCDGR